MDQRRLTSIINPFQPIEHQQLWGIFGCPLLILPNQTSSSSLIFIFIHSSQNRFYYPSNTPIFISLNSYYYSLILPPFSTISPHFYPSTSSIVENVEKPVENLPKILNYIQILSNYYSNIQEIPRKPSLYILSSQIIIRLVDLTYIFSINYVIRLEGRWIGNYIGSLV